MSRRLWEEFRLFHEVNPHVYPLINRFTYEALAAGFTHYGIGAIFERIRWYINIETKSPELFKMPNNHRAYYARVWMKKHPKEKGFFRLRRLDVEDIEVDEFDVPLGWFDD